jgi:hypothetical protein
MQRMMQTAILRAVAGDYDADGEESKSVKRSEYCTGDIEGSCVPRWTALEDIDGEHSEEQTL